ncbi:MAG: PilZ domain-containing protein [Myxococcales bacterium]|nr:MAG: PilZ domain-containing protein [Myxococcales bacterium]
MQAAVDRRIQHEPRIPFNASVELANQTFDAAVEADGVDLSPRGLKVRAPMMPELGSWLRCRFQVEPGAPGVEAEGEVVWISDSGSHMGEFGVRFAQVDPDIEQWVRDFAERHSGEDFEEEFSGVRQKDDLDEADQRLADFSMSTELRIDHLRTPVLTRMAHQAKDLVILEQDLPFLRIHTGVEVADSEWGQKAGRLASVDLQMVGNMPKLCLGVIFDDFGSASSVAHKSPDTVQDLEAPEPPPLDLSKQGPIVEQKSFDYEDMPTPVHNSAPQLLMKALQAEREEEYQEQRQQEREEQRVHAFETEKQTKKDDISASFPTKESYLFQRDSTMLGRVQTGLARAAVQTVAHLSTRSAMLRERIHQLSSKRQSKSISRGSKKM